MKTLQQVIGKAEESYARMLSGDENFRVVLTM
jgi:hypothetical protein